jgi:hypothetical protein
MDAADFVETFVPVFETNAELHGAGSKDPFLLPVYSGCLVLLFADSYKAVGHKIREI